MKLSILILTIPEREEMYERIREKLLTQMRPFKGQVELLTDDRTHADLPSDTSAIPYVFPRLTKGEKRNHLLNEASGEYLQAVDDDDDIANDFIQTQMEALHLNPGVDCLSLRGVVTTDGRDPQIFEHSKRYDLWKENPIDAPVRYERPPNHLNVIKASIAKQFRFEEIDHGEDRLWSEAIHRSGLIKTECYIDKVLYHYLYRTVKKEMAA